MRTKNPLHFSEKNAIIKLQKWGEKMTREELKEQIDELMRQYHDEEIDGATYEQKMMELTTSAQDEISED